MGSSDHDPSQEEQVSSNSAEEEKMGKDLEDSDSDSLVDDDQQQDYDLKGNAYDSQQQQQQQDQEELEQGYTSGDDNVEAKVVKIQALARGSSTRRDIRKQHEHATRIQKVHRGSSARKEYLDTKEKVVKIQSHGRVVVAKKKARKVKEEKSAIKIQARQRGASTRRKYHAKKQRKQVNEMMQKLKSDIAAESERRRHSAIMAKQQLVRKASLINDLKRKRIEKHEQKRQDTFRELEILDRKQRRKEKNKKLLKKLKQANSLLKKKCQSVSTRLDELIMEEESNYRRILEQERAMTPDDVLKERLKKLEEEEKKLFPVFEKAHTKNKEYRESLDHSLGSDLMTKGRRLQAEAKDLDNTLKRLQAEVKANEVVVVGYQKQSLEDHERDVAHFVRQEKELLDEIRQIRDQIKEEKRTIIGSLEQSSGDGYSNDEQSQLEHALREKNKMLAASIKAHEAAERGFIQTEKALKRAETFLATKEQKSIRKLERANTTKSIAMESKMDKINAIHEQKLETEHRKQNGLRKKVKDLAQEQRKLQEQIVKLDIDLRKAKTFKAKLRKVPIPPPKRIPRSPNADTRPGRKLVEKV